MTGRMNNNNQDPFVLNSGNFFKMNKNSLDHKLILIKFCYLNNKSISEQIMLLL